MCKYSRREFIPDVNVKVHRMEICHSQGFSHTCYGMQIACEAEGGLVARVLMFRPEDQGGSYLKLVILNAAGSGSLRSIRIRSSIPQV